MNNYHITIPCSHPRYGLTDCEKEMSGDLLRVMMLRATSSRTWVRGDTSANSSPASPCQPSSTASLTVTSKRPGR